MTKKEMIKGLFHLAALSAILVLFVVGVRFLLHRSLQRRVCTDPSFRIRQLVEIPDGPTALRAGTIEKLVGLGDNENLFTFDLVRAERTLLAHPLIESARLWRCPPSALTVSYRVRSPFAELCEWPELLIDKAGYLFPYRPHFTPKRLPKLSLGLQKFTQRVPTPILTGEERGILRGKNIELGLKILQHLAKVFANEGTQIANLDVSMAFDENLGRREVKLVLEDRIFFEKKPLICQRHLRMNSEHWGAQLERYRALLAPLAGEEMRMAQTIEPQMGGEISKLIVEEIDLRLPQLAHLKLEVVERDRF